MKILRTFAAFLVLASSSGLEPTWESLDQRPVPRWYEDAKFGVFLHWGVFSVPSFGSEWFWEYWEHSRSKAYQDFVDRTERPGFAYTDYVHRFTAELYRPEQWAEIFALAGAQYVVLTSKHHEGFAMWNSSTIPTTWNWNVMDVGPRRDVLGELSRAVQASISPMTKKPIEFGVYHSLYEWFNPLYLEDKAKNFTSSRFVDEKTGVELYDLVRRYQPTLIWSDGEWEAESSYWKATQFLHWYATESPVAAKAVWNDRWGRDALCKHGSFLTCVDRYNPGRLNPKKWENAFTIDKSSWGLNRNASLSDYYTVEQLTHILIEVVAYNGNFLLNAGPAADGTLHPIFVDRLLGIGEWLKVNGEAIYGTRPWHVCQNEKSSHVFYTQKDDRLFAHMTKWPKHGTLHLDCISPTEQFSVSMLGLDDPLNWTLARKGSPRGKQQGLDIFLNGFSPDLLPCEHAWVLVMKGAGNLVSQTNILEL